MKNTLLDFLKKHFKSLSDECDYNSKPKKPKKIKFDSKTVNKLGSFMLSSERFDSLYANCKQRFEMLLYCEITKEFPELDKKGLTQQINEKIVTDCACCKSNCQNKLEHEGIDSNTIKGIDEELGNKIIQIGDRIKQIQEKTTDPTKITYLIMNEFLNLYK